MKKYIRVCKIFFLFLLLLTLVIPSVGVFCATNNFPVRANYFLPLQITDSDARELAKWDLVILDMEAQAKSPQLLRKIRQLNPRIIILAYITAQEIRNDALTGANPMRQKLARGISADWYLTDKSGEKYTFWPGTEMLNVADNCPAVGGQRWNDYLVNFATREILYSGYWDGIFFDNGWDGISWFAGSRVDLNKDGVEDIDADAHWQAGLKYIFNRTRELAGNKYLVVFNGTGKLYADNTNGMMQENFPRFGWSKAMEIYNANQNGKILPRIGIINGNARNANQPASYRNMRYGLASALLENGYYSFDFGDQNHGQIWWYDEYDVNLGEPVGEAAAQSGAPKYREDVWRRDFSQGIALVNATGGAKTVNLGGDFEKIRGRQDAEVNNGEITDKVNLPARDGLIMLKTFQTIKNVIFSNGDFLSFFNLAGQRARNGFFAYEEGAPGGAKIYHGDLNADGVDEKIVESGGKMEIFNSAGARWFSDYLLSGDFKGEARLAVGRLLPGGQDEILAASSKGGKIILFNYHGAILRDAFYPLGKKYRGGFTAAIGNVDGGDGEAIFGSNGEVLIFDGNLAKIKKRFFPYQKNFKGGVMVAAGDVNGDLKDEIITLPASKSADARWRGNNNLVRVFDGSGKKITEFSLGSIMGNGAMLGAADITFDGKDEIVAGSR